MSIPPPIRTVIAAVATLTVLVACDDGTKSESPKASSSSSSSPKILQTHGSRFVPVVNARQPTNLGESESLQTFVEDSRDFEGYVAVSTDKNQAEFVAYGNDGDLEALEVRGKNFRLEDKAHKRVDGQPFGGTAEVIVPGKGANSFAPGKSRVTMTVQMTEKGYVECTAKVTNNVRSGGILEIGSIIC